MHPGVSHVYGDLLIRLIASDRGLSSKCLVLDLDNTLWGGVIGDDGLDGIALGQGNSLGEAFVAFQRYVLGLKRRGVILAVCSKNDHKNALQVPLNNIRRWFCAAGHCLFRSELGETRQATCARSPIALNIGLDSLVFVDDNPFERNLIRQELPQIAVPEIPKIHRFIYRAWPRRAISKGWSITAEDRERNEQYQANAERELLRESSLPT